MMAQYRALKEEVGDAILFYRMGDFYEMFFEDAVTAARLCDLTLTSRNKSDPEPIPMAGVPWHSAEPHVQRLLAAGRRVAICEQVERPGERGLMERQIVEVLTPGTAVAEHLLEEGSNNHLVAVRPGPDRWGLAAADVSTGDLWLGELPPAAVAAELRRWSPRELIYPREEERLPLLAAWLREAPGLFRAPLDGWLFSSSRGRTALLEQWGVASLEAFGIEELDLAIAAGGALVSYARDQRRAPLTHLRPPRRLTLENALLLDEATLANLEVLEPLGASGGHCLLAVLDATRTPMGARLLRRTLTRPLLEVDRIRARQGCVQALVEDRGALERLRTGLGDVGDIERILGRLHAGKARPRDLARLRDALRPLPALIEIVGALHDRAPFPWGVGLDPAADLRSRLQQALVEDALRAPAGEVIRPGYDAHLDEQRELARGGEEWLAQLQARERAATGITPLKVGYNRVFGYYLEITRAHADRVPDHYERRQTLVGAERYVTPELKGWEERILGAQEAARTRQDQLIEELKSAAVAETRALQRIAEAVGEWDLLACFAQRAIEGRYVRPEIDDGDVVRVTGGRHPVIERCLEGGSFVPNDVEVDTRGRQILILTGPNMAGKSTYLRQVGLLVLMAQAGSFIPADEAHIGVADRLFTRVGASDRIAAGQSTFLVEMIETSRILHEATSRSLVLLDEVGRGTSTFDGLAIAWAVAEHLRERPLRRPRTLFATHFHELTELARRREGYCNLNVEVKEWQEQVIFVRRVIEGAADRSYGIHVAQLAGLPEVVLGRAREILALLEEHGPRDLLLPGRGGSESLQIALFGRGGGRRGAQRLAERVADALEPAGIEAELLEAFNALDPERLSPREALDWLFGWKLRWRNRGDDDVQS